jgi:raffinose/stachyose/melibiose transport system substrate-binding protein
MSRRSLVTGAVLAGGAFALNSLLAACSGAPAQPTAAPATTAPAPAQPTAAPSNAAPTPAQPAATAPSQASTYQGKFVVVGVYNPDQGMAKLNKDFETAHAGVQIQYQFVTSEKFTEIFASMQNSNEQVDALVLNGQDLRRYATGGQLIDMSQQIGYQSRFRPIGLKTYSIGGKLWALPFGGIGGFVVWYNKAILDKLGQQYPATFQDLVALKTALKKDNVAVFTHPGKNIYLWPVWFFTTYAQTTKNQSVEKTIATLNGQGKFTDPEVVQGLDAVFKYGTEGLFIEGVNSLDTASNTASWLTDKAVFTIVGSLPDVRKANPPNFTLDVGVMPQLTDNKVDSQFPGGTGAALTIYQKVAPERRSLAFDYLEFLTRDENVSYLASQLHSSVTTNVNAKASDDPIAGKLAGMVDHLTIYLDWYWPPEITRAFQENLQAGVGGQKTGLDAAKDIQAAFDKLVAGGYKYEH